MGLGDWESPTRQGATKLFRRASIDGIDFSNPGPIDQRLSMEIPRPSSAYSRPLLPNIHETPPSKSGKADVRFDPTDIFEHLRDAPKVTVTPNQNLCGLASSINVPASSVPDRGSSMYRVEMTASDMIERSIDLAFSFPSPPKGLGHKIPDPEKSDSPHRAAAKELDPRASEVNKTPSNAISRTVMPMDILVEPQISHPRISIDMRLVSPLFMGGATVEGHIDVVVDGGKEKTRRKSLPVMSIGAISVDVLGVETSYGKHYIFRSLSSQLIDERHPPPSNMCHVKVLHESFWDLLPSTSILPFRLDLPVKMGPPPYRAKYATIKYLLCATVIVMISGKQHLMRKSQEVAILSVHDPEKALVNLPSPLTATDTLLLPKSSPQSIVTLTAGVHRQVWVSGIALFVDIRISNNSIKPVKRIDVQLERVTTFYNHAPASTAEEMGDYLRLPDQTEKKVLARRCMKKAKAEWQGVGVGEKEEKTWDLDVPTGLVTVETGRFFGVRFFLNVLVTVASKVLTVQIPITIIHPNSLDILPNSLAQVTLAINNALSRSRSTHRCKRTNSSIYQPKSTTPYRFTQGSAFSAPRRRSTEQMRSSFASQRNVERVRGQFGSSQVEELTRLVDGSPPKGALNRSTALFKRNTKENTAPHETGNGSGNGNGSGIRYGNGTSIDNPNHITVNPWPLHHPTRSYGSNSRLDFKPRRPMHPTRHCSHRAYSSFDKALPRLHQSTSGLGLDEYSYGSCSDANWESLDSEVEAPSGGGFRVSNAFRASRSANPPLRDVGAAAGAALPDRAGVAWRILSRERDNGAGERRAHDPNRNTRANDTGAPATYRNSTKPVSYIAPGSGLQMREQNHRHQMQTSRGRDQGWDQNQQYQSQSQMHLRQHQKPSHQRQRHPSRGQTYHHHHRQQSQSNDWKKHHQGYPMNVPESSNKGPRQLQSGRGGKGGLTDLVHGPSAARRPDEKRVGSRLTRGERPVVRGVRSMDAGVRPKRASVVFEGTVERRSLGDGRVFEKVGGEMGKKSWL